MDAVAEADTAALDLTLYEVANVARVRWRSPARAEQLVVLVLDTVGQRLVRIDTDFAAAALSASERHGLSLHDAACVACAERRGWRLVSTDLRDLVGRGLAVTPDAVSLDAP